MKWTLLAKYFLIHPSHPRSQALLGIAQGRLCLHNKILVAMEAEPPGGFRRQSLGTRGYEFIFCQQHHEM